MQLALKRKTFTFKTKNISGVPGNFVNKPLFNRENADNLMFMIHF